MPIIFTSIKTELNHNHKFTNFIHLFCQVHGEKIQSCKGCNKIDIGLLTAVAFQLCQYNLGRGFNFSRSSRSYPDLRCAGSENKWPKI